MLRVYMLTFGCLWNDHLHLIEFAYNFSFQANIKMVPFKAMHGKKCRSLIYWNDIREETNQNKDDVLDDRQSKHDLSRLKDSL